LEGIAEERGLAKSEIMLIQFEISGFSTEIVKFAGKRLSADVEKIQPWLEVLMTDPVLSPMVAAISDLVFRKFTVSSATELANKFMTNAIAKMDEPRQKIWDKLRGVPTSDAALTLIENRDLREKDRVVAHLQIAIDSDPPIANEIRQLAQQIYAGKLQDNRSMTQNNADNARG
jgi:hypothetical protein